MVSMNFARVKGIKSLGKKSTYDISMASPHHNYILGNGVIVHNSFNRAHATCYSKIAWQMAWYKRHYPVYFYAEMMNWDKGNLQEYLLESVSKSINIFPPHINVSSSKCEVKDGSIYLPITMVKFLSYTGAKEITTARKQGTFKHYEDFARRITRRAVNSRARLGLYAIGGFDKMEGDPKLAGIDVGKIDNGSIYSRQIAYMGAMIPDKNLISLIKRYSNGSGKVVGVIGDTKRKESKYGPYTVFHVAPSGTFWIRDADFDKGSLCVGDFVIAEVSKNTGKAESVELVR